VGGSYRYLCHEVMYAFRRKEKSKIKKFLVTKVTIVYIYVTLRLAKLLKWLTLAVQLSPFSVPKKKLRYPLGLGFQCFLFCITATPPFVVSLFCSESYGVCSSDQGFYLNFPFPSCFRFNFWS